MYKQTRNILKPSSTFELNKKVQSCETTKNERGSLIEQTTNTNHIFCFKINLLCQIDLEKYDYL